MTIQHIRRLSNLWSILAAILSLATSTTTTSAFSLHMSTSTSNSSSNGKEIYGIKNSGWSWVLFFIIWSNDHVVFWYLYFLCVQYTISLPLSIVRILLHNLFTIFTPSTTSISHIYTYKALLNGTGDQLGAQVTVVLPFVVVNMLPSRIERSY